MDNLIPRNTYKRGRVTVFIYPEKDYFVAVCLELGLVEIAKTLEKANEYIDDAIKLHVKTVVKNKLSEDLLNRPASKKYWRKFEIYLRRRLLLAEMMAGRARKRPPRDDWTSTAILNILNLSNSNIIPCVK